MTHDKTFEWFTDRAEEKLFHQLDYNCVYAIGAGDGALRIGWAGNPIQKLQKMQQANWRPLRLAHVQWTIGAMLATRLQKEAARVLRAEGREVLGDWYRLKPEEVEPMLQSFADEAGIPSFQHDEMLLRVRSIRQAQITEAVRRSGVDRVVTA